MDNLQRATVSLSLFDDDLDPSDITRMLGAEPDIGARKGDTFLGLNGMQREADTGMWQLSTGWETPPHLNRQIASLLGKLTNDLGVWTKIKERTDCHISVGGYFSDWTGGFFLEAKTITLLAERGLGIDFDLYAPSASDG